MTIGHDKALHNQRANENILCKRSSRRSVHGEIFAVISLAKREPRTETGSQPVTADPGRCELQCLRPAWLIAEIRRLVIQTIAVFRQLSLPFGGNLNLYE